jgi:DNA-binding YbaB/EbfC family protein
MSIEDLMGGPDGLKNLMGQAQKIQLQLKEAQERAERREVVGEAGGGLVKVTANGRQEILSLKIDPVAVDPRDVEMLEDLVRAAVNVALGRAREAMGEEMGSLGSMLNLSGLKL